MSENTIKIFTDGACKGNPGLGGWGALIIENEKKKRFTAVALIQQITKWS